MVYCKRHSKEMRYINFGAHTTSSDTKLNGDWDQLQRVRVLVEPFDLTLDVNV